VNTLPVTMLGITTCIGERSGPSDPNTASYPALRPTQIPSYQTSKGFPLSIHTARGSKPGRVPGTLDLWNIVSKSMINRSSETILKVLPSLLVAEILSFCTAMLEFLGSFHPNRSLDNCSSFPSCPPRLSTTIQTPPIRIRSSTSSISE
jgi:hypothetical protein